MSVLYVHTHENDGDSSSRLSGSSKKKAVAMTGLGDV
jgi:hypothetical protein